MSERRACQVVGQHRSTQRYRPEPPELELRLAARMNELAAAHPRWGYRKIWSLLRGEGFPVNRKRVERLWRLEGHRVPPRRTIASGKRAQGTAENASWNRPASRPNDVWSYDFMSEVTRDGRPVRILNVVDEFTRVAVGCRVARRIGATDVTVELDAAYVRLRVANGPGKDTADDVVVMVTEVRRLGDSDKTMAEARPIGLPLTWSGSSPPLTVAAVHPGPERHIDLLHIDWPARDELDIARKRSATVPVPCLPSSASCRQCCRWQVSRSAP